MQTNTVASISIRRITQNISTHIQDQLAIEEPLEIQLAYREGAKSIIKIISVTMRTPGSDEELAVGFLFTEGIIKRNEWVRKIEQKELGCNRVRVNLQANIVPVLQKTERNFYTTSSCGVCGKTSIESIKTVSVYKDSEDDILLNAALFCRLPHLLRQQQRLFESTGGLHAAALFDLHGNFIMLREDVGRHNALDKLIGTAFLDDRLPLNDSILLLSGRASFELLQKATMAGIKIVASIGAPSSLAVELAAESGITLIGFLGHEKFNIYSGEKRIRGFE
jgi:FdhD protein